MSQRTHSARLHALAAALCALLLLVALCAMDANRAPWWALLATQGVLLVATASAGMWLDRAGGERRRGDEALRGPDGNGVRYTVRGTAGSPSTEQFFWQERAKRTAEEDDEALWGDRILRWNREEE